MSGIEFGLLSDIHLFRKPHRLISALRMLRDVDILLVAGDLADRGTEEQYQLLWRAFEGYPEDIPVFIVSGNHDIPGNDVTSFRAFERRMLERSGKRYEVESDPCGAFYIRLKENLDLIGLNPSYHQKVFHFPNKGAQLAFLEERLMKSGCGSHILLCHPPLMAHNSQKGKSYFPPEQDARLQRIVDRHPHILFLSGHTHLFPEIEPEDEYGNRYVNGGSICPTQSKGKEKVVLPGNVIRFEAEDKIVGIRAEFLGGTGRKEEGSDSKSDRIGGKGLWD